MQHLKRLTHVVSLMGIKQQLTHAPSWTRNNCSPEIRDITFTFVQGCYLNIFEALMWCFIYLKVRSFAWKRTAGIGVFGVTWFMRAG